MSRKFRICKYKKGPVLPDGYTRLEYLETDGTAYLDLNITQTVNNKVEIKYMFTEITRNMAGVYGLLYQAGHNMGFCYLATNHFDNYFGALINDGYSTDISAYLNTEYTDITYDTTFLHNGITCSINCGPQVETLMNIYLFNINMPDSIRQRFQIYPQSGFRIYYTKLWDGDVLVRSLVPAKNNENILGMYDLVSKTFFTNAAETGTFIAGPDDPYEIKESIIESKDSMGNTKFKIIETGDTNE